MAHPSKCGDTHKWAALSYISCSYSIIACLFTIPLNIAVILSIIKSGNYRTKFYMIILNIAVSDLLIGLVTEPLGAIFLIKEGLQIGPTLPQIYVFLVSLFLLGTSSVLSMAFLNFDRYISIQFPHKYDQIKTWHIITGFSIIWIFSAFSGYLSITVGFSRYLLIFSLCNVLFTVTVMCITMRTFWRKLVTISAPEDNRLSLDPSNQNSRFATTRVFSIGRFRATTNERRIIRTLFFMLAIFISSYFPILLACLYLNACVDCDCLTVQILRDIVIAAILASSIARPVNFLHRLSNLRNEIRCKLC